MAVFAARIGLSTPQGEAKRRALEAIEPIVTRMHPKPVSDELYTILEYKVAGLQQTAEIDDTLSEILRTGAKRLIVQAVDAEFSAFPSAHK